jgi:hypothetical protein
MRPVGRLSALQRDVFVRSRMRDPQRHQPAAHRLTGMSNQGVDPATSPEVSACQNVGRWRPHQEQNRHRHGRGPDAKKQGQDYEAGEQREGGRKRACRSHGRVW